MSSLLRWWAPARVGWVERTRNPSPGAILTMGFASLNPSYSASRGRPAIVSRYCAATQTPIHDRYSTRAPGMVEICCGAFDGTALGFTLISAHSNGGRQHLVEAVFWRGEVCHGPALFPQVR